MMTDRIEPTALDRIVMMLVEDSETDAEAIRRALIKGGFDGTLDHHVSGETALAALYATEPTADGSARLPGCLPHLILLDLNLPGIDGRDVLRRIKSDRALHKIPIVVLTSSSVRLDIDRSYALGANSYIPKPVSFESLTEVMRHACHYWFSIAVVPKPGV